MRARKSEKSEKSEKEREMNSSQNFDPAGDGSGPSPVLAIAGLCAASAGAYGAYTYGMKQTREHFMKMIRTYASLKNRRRDFLAQFPEESELCSELEKIAAEKTGANIPTVAEKRTGPVAHVEALNVAAYISWLFDQNIISDYPKGPNGGGTYELDELLSTDFRGSLHREVESRYLETISLNSSLLASNAEKTLQINQLQKSLEELRAKSAPPAVTPAAPPPTAQTASPPATAKLVSDYISWATGKADRAFHYQTGLPYYTKEFRAELSQAFSKELKPWEQEWSAKLQRCKRFEGTRQLNFLMGYDVKGLQPNNGKIDKSSIIRNYMKFLFREPPDALSFNINGSTDPPETMSNFLNLLCSILDDVELSQMASL